jgi:nucleotidyltransferase substrate binding protein (TIGR01987 family)
MSSDSRAARLKRATLLLGDFARALQRLADVLQQPETEFIRDAAIQRFEFCFELGWKAVQAAAMLEGQECASPRAAVSTAWRNGWIGDEAAWLDMLDDRNKTSHTYREAIAREVFGAVSRHLPQLGELHRALVNRVAEIESQTRQGPTH